MMIRFLLAVLAMTLCASVAWSAPVAVKTDKAKKSYTIGYQVGNGYKSENIDIDVDALAKGMKDALAGKKSALTEDEMRAAIAALQQEAMTKRAERIKVMADKNKAEGDKFLAVNKAKQGVVTLEDGLQYRIITEGKGAKPAASDKVKVNYKGTLIDGTEFDSSYKRGNPAVFEVDKVIPGWTKILQMMPEGSKWEVVIPSNLAYGERGSLPVIGPNQTLIFEIDFISIEK